MKRLIIALSSVVLLSACGDSGENQSDPINNNPPAQSGTTQTAPADRDPTPQSGTGGQSPVTSPSGTTQTAPGNNTPPGGTGNPADTISPMLAPLPPASSASLIPKSAMSST